MLGMVSPLADFFPIKLSLAGPANMHETSMAKHMVRKYLFLLGSMAKVINSKPEI
jgi:hypothetical protein